MGRHAMEEKIKRVSLMIREDQHDKLHDMGVNISGFVRDLIDDHLSDYTITLAVSEETRQLYNKVVSNTGSSDSEIEVYLRDALKEMLKHKIKEMQNLQKNLEKE